MLGALTFSVAHASSPVTLSPSASLTEPWRWTKLEDLSGYWIRQIKPGQEGRLWAAAAEGLLEYDGLSTKVHPVPPATGTPSNASQPGGLLGLEIGADGSIYALAASALLRWQNGGWTRLLETNVHRLTANCLAKDREGRIWLTVPNGLFRLTGDAVTPVLLPGGPFFTCHIDAENRLWLAEEASGRILRYRLDEVSGLPVEPLLTLPGTSPGESSSAEIVSGPEGVWICDGLMRGAALRRIIDGRMEVVLPNLSDLGLPGQARVASGANGILFLISPGVLAEWRNGNWTVHGSELRHLPTGYPIIASIASDRFALTGRRDNVFELDLSGQRWETWEELQFAGSTPTGDSWFLSADRRVLRRQGDTSLFVRFDDADGIIESPNHLLIDSRGAVWASGSHQDHAAVARWDGFSWTRWTHPELGRIVSHQGVVELADGQILFGAGEPGNRVLGGAVVYRVDRPEQGGTHWRPPALPFRVSSVAETADGTLWVGGPGVWRRSPGAEAVRLPEFGRNWVDQVVRDHRGDLWVAMWGAGAYWRQADGRWRLFTESEGLASIGAVAILPQRNGKGVWLATHEGLCHFDGTAWHPNPLTRDLRFERESTTLREGTDGTLWINLAYRAWFFNSAPRPSERERRVRSLHYRGDDAPPQTILLEGPTRAPEGGLLYFRWQGRDAFSRTSESQLQYSWRINQDVWSPFTGAREHVVYHPAAGSHVFSVRARDGDGNVDLTPAAVAFVVLPVYWKQPWFIAIAVFAVAALVWLTAALVRSRIRHLVAMKAQQLHFFTNVSHELRNPLAVVLGPLQSLLESCSDAGLKGTLEMIYRNARKLEGLVDQLLEFRSSQLGHMALNPSRGDVVACLREFVEDYTLLWRNKGQTLVLKLPDRPWVGAFDRMKLQHLVGNLLSNAIKYTPEHGHLLVTATIRAATESDPAQLTFSVTDDGPGIPAHLRRKIFQPFFRAASKDSNVGGFGIGLAYVDEIVQLWGGGIRVESPPAGGERGSRFTVTLPLASSPLAAEVAANPAAADPTLSYPDAENDPDEHLQATQRSRPLVLVVEDDADVRAFLAAELGRDYDVLVAVDGQAGLEAVLAEPPDLAVCDLAMPRIDGVELCRRLKTSAETSHIPVILLTARRSEDAQVQGAEVGADAYLTKPVDLRLLRARVAALLESRRQLRAKFTRQVVVQPNQITVTPVDEALITKALAVLESQMEDHQFGVDAFAQAMGMSRVTLYRKLSAVTGQAPSRFIRTIRLKRAAQLLATGQLTVGEAMTKVGILEPSYFSRVFREEFGVTPSEYRQQPPPHDTAN